MEKSASVFEAAKMRPTIPILPRFVMEDGQGRVYLPGDPSPHEP
jgi:hypothetical protein